MKKYQTYDISDVDPAESVVRKLTLIMVETALQQREGIITAIDAEPLHRYRINLRKARALLNLTKPSAKYRRIKRILADLAGATNALRDLDVLLENKKRYGDRFPDSLRIGFDGLFEQVAKEREKQFLSIKKYVTSPHFGNRCHELREALEPNEDNREASVSPSIMTVTSKAIYRHYRNIYRSSTKISRATPDVDIHKLRIECKKLRYLMETFSELYNHHEPKSPIKHLADLQFFLGRFNDYSVQIDFLLHQMQSTTFDDRQHLATGRLAKQLSNKKEKMRRKISSTLRRFCNDKIKREFRRLYHSRIKNEASSSV